MCWDKKNIYISLLKVLKIQQNRIHYPKQKTGKCCLLPTAERLEGLAEGWIGLKRGELTEK